MEIRRVGAKARACSVYRAGEGFPDRTAEVKGARSRRWMGTRQAFLGVLKSEARFHPEGTTEPWKGFVVLFPIDAYESSHKILR